MDKKINTVQEIRLQYHSRFQGEEPVIKSAEEAYQIVKDYFEADYLTIREEMVILYLNPANKVLGVYKGFSGGMTATVVDIRLILAVALKGLSTGIILFHNHPSGSLTASEADKKLTGKLQKAAELFGIKVLDHLIVSAHGTYLSFADAGFL